MLSLVHVLALLDDPEHGLVNLVGRQAVGRRGRPVGGGQLAVNKIRQSNASLAFLKNLFAISPCRAMPAAAKGLGESIG